MYFIYFIKVAENIKIGICKATLKHLKQRLSEANRWYPNSKILGILTTEDKEIEKRIHLRFKDNNINSEVFKLDKRITRFIFDYCDWTPNKRFCPFLSDFQWSLFFREDKKTKFYKEKTKSLSLSLDEWTTLAVAESAVDKYSELLEHIKYNNDDDDDRDESEIDDEISEEISKYSLSIYSKVYNKYPCFSKLEMDVLNLNKEKIDNILPYLPEREKEYFNYHNNDTYWDEIGRYGLG